MKKSKSFYNFTAEMLFEWVINIIILLSHPILILRHGT